MLKINNMSSNVSLYKMILFFTSLFVVFLLKGNSMSIDYFSYSLVLLTLWVGIMMLSASLTYLKFYSFVSGKSWIYLFMVIFLLLAFLSKSFISFYVFFELSMIPILLYIMGWGTDLEKWEASLLMFLFTYLGSVFYLFVIFSIFGSQGTLMFNLIELSESMNLSVIYMFSFMFIFLVKLPVFFFHIWLPMAHVESPLMGSMILAGIMLKLGGYGMMKVNDCFYFSLMEISSYLIILGLFGAIYSALDCIFQADYKRVVALSSVSHMSMVVAGLSTGTLLGKWGSFSLMMSHGISSSAFFYALGILYYRLHSRSLMVIRGIISISPLIGLFWFLLFSYNLAFPPLLPFMAEVSMLWSIYSLSGLFFLIIALLVMISSIYTVLLYTQFFSNKTSSFISISSLSVMELLIIFFHSFSMILMTLLVWLW